MRPRTVRARVVGAAALSILVAVSLLGVSVGWLTARQLRSELDHSLQTRAQDVARLAISAPALLSAPGTLDTPAGGRQLSVEVLDRRGGVVARSAALGARLLPATALVTRAIQFGRAAYDEADLSGQRVRLLAVPVADIGGPAAGGAVVASSSLEEIDHSLTALRGAIALSALVAAALGALAAALLTQRGLAPLSRLSDAAAAIARTGDASQRLPTPDTRDELAALARTLNSMLAALARSQQTERDFLADASHELRTPLTSLRGNAAYLARHGLDPGALADLEQDAARLSRLVDDLLALERERAAPAPREPIALHELVAQVADRQGAVVAHNDRLLVDGERDALERALGNLIENAHLHGPPGSPVTVTLRRHGAGARLSVSDQGLGPSERERERVFDRFWRGLDAAGQPGSGLGLALVRAIAARHEASVSVEGSRFTIEFGAVRELSS